MTDHLNKRSRGLTTDIIGVAETTERESLPAPEFPIKTADDVVFLLCEATVLNVWPEVIEPSQAAALAAAVET